ncbi:LamG-like jellyroll fold domain-containing protein [Pseudoalteromonas aurantia]|uniref:OmpR/PhoB-type domain-containing protein n=1 Tax=Pseudoalteromonas aurantia TaxID=43654 RepID=A0A5S3V7Y2_9GAMM|nr:LamG-like jellyroll fold domain-containing protein [Pseudoalteromonas aurantia]TMO59538.1 hypothetical protein CWC18_15320 [Pseudoalteromonas aurantia]TMO67201.1 hypothetical protein CWC19_14710 [Pseudoalteromonas aurantia]TMO74552.1 hypothetical protein CWC20_09945 [Pseudoalteromonas aurantia]
MDKNQKHMSEQPKQVSTSTTTPQQYIGVWVHDVYVSFTERKAFREDIDLNLSDLSYNLLICLIIKSPTPLSSRELLDLVWGKVVTADENVKQRICILRKQLEHPEKYNYIKNRRGHGYYIDAPLKWKKNNLIQILKKKTNHQKVVLSSSISVVIFIILLLASNENQTNTTHIAKITSDSVHLATKTKDLAFCLDGFDDYIELANQDILDVGLGDFSITAWIRTKALGQHIIIDKQFGDQISDARGYAFYIDDGYIALQLADEGGTWYCQETDSSCTFYNSQAFAADNQWHHVAVSIDRDKVDGIRFYLNGEHIDSHDPTNRQGSLSNSMPLRIGSRSSYISGLFQGAIGEVVLHHKVLTPPAIQAHFHAGNSRHCYNIAQKGGVVL